MTEVFVAVIYIMLCLLVGLNGVGRWPGFAGAFLGSLLLTPFAVFFLLYTTRRRPSEDST